MQQKPKMKRRERKECLNRNDVETCQMAGIAYRGNGMRFSEFARFLTQFES